MALIRTTALASALVLSFPLHAQVAPDAGRTLQETVPPVQPPRPSPEITIEPPSDAAVAPEGGVRVTLQSVGFSGNTVFDEATLQAALGDVVGREFDLAGLRELAARVSAFYRGAGYPFARAFLPAQAIRDGALRIEVIEGRYGQIRADGEADLAAGAQRFLGSLQAGDVIEGGALERTALLLDDLPGVRAVPIIRPGQELGTGDMIVRVERERRYALEVGADNHGNRYTGQGRARVNLGVDSPFMLGDQFLLRGLLTQEGMWFGHAGYSLPVGVSGLRAQFAYAHTYYQLERDFAALDASGTAKTTSAGLSYPLLRSQRANVNLSVNLQYKDLNDKQGATQSSSDKSSHALPVTLGFDLRDGLGGGGMTYGALAWTPGRLDLDSGLAALDRTTARTEGGFSRYNLDVARLQLLPAGFNLFGRLSAQWASRNLDSSEGFGLGGPNGVRAYPVGEGYGDEGALAQVELRWTHGALSPYGFYDIGRVRTDARRWQAIDNSRSISGAGFGLRAQDGGWNFDASFAWRLSGGAPQSDTKDRLPRVWVSAGYSF